MIHHANKTKVTGCCQVRYTDLPMSDELTFKDHKVTCGTNPLRHANTLAQWLYEETRSEDARRWCDVPGGERDHLVGVARKALTILGYPTHD